MTDFSTTREPDISKEKISIITRLGRKFDAIFSKAYEPQTDISAVLCPGFGVGKEGEFVTSMERELFLSDSIASSIRFNFCGHNYDDLNGDLTGFTFEDAVADFQAVVQSLRAISGNRIVVFGSSTGVQPAILASCQDGPSADLIIGRSSVIDCFQSKINQIPNAQLQAMKEASEFDFPIGNGDNTVKLSSNLIRDIESIDLETEMAKLTTPVKLIHGDMDEVIPLHTITESTSLAPNGVIEVEVIEGQYHEMSNDPRSDEFQWMINTLSQFI